MPRLVRVLAPAAVLLIVAVGALLLALAIGGAASAPLLVDPGDIVRYGKPVATVVLDLAMALAFGALALVVFVLASERPGIGNAPAVARPEYGRALDIAAVGASVWTVAAMFGAFFDFETAFATAPSLDPAFGGALGSYLTGVSAGQAWLTTIATGAILTVVCIAVRNQTFLGIVTVAAAFALIPLAEQGHAGGTASHNVAITALWLHLVFAALWVGGLVALALVRPALASGRIGEVLPRYSSIALVCFIVVGFSGVVSAVVRVGTWDGLLTPYGLLVVVKTVALCALGVFGVLQRRWLIGKVVASGTATPRVFWGFVTLELAVMGIASGVAAALAETAPPVSAEAPTDPTPAQYLTGSPLPPELTPDRWFTQWSLDPLWAIVCLFLAAFYLAGVIRLARRGDKWPVGRTVSWLLGVAVLAWVTNGAPNAYVDYLFSVHMLSHMILTMGVPILLVLGAPVTLLLRAAKKRDDGSRGPREWVLLLVHTRVARFLTNPIVAALLFALSLWAFYYTPLLRWAVTDHVGHEWMILHFLITGYLFAQVLVGTDPISGRPPYALRLLLLLATMAFHAFFGLAIMSQTGLFLADWFGAMGRTWGNPPYVDQQWGGGIAWTIGEIPTVCLAIVVAVLWSRSDEREATRVDRKAARDNDAELQAYNAMLAKRAERDAKAERVER